MTPDRRLDQLEPLMADSLQKIDRLIEGQGQIIEVAVRADTNAETAARGVANLTITVQQGFANVQGDTVEIKGDVVELKGDTVEIKSDVVELKGNVIEMKGDVIELIAGQARLEANQQEILKLLRGRL